MKVCSSFLWTFNDPFFHLAFLKPDKIYWTKFHINQFNVRAKKYRQKLSGWGPLFGRLHQIRFAPELFIQQSQWWSSRLWEKDFFLDLSITWSRGEEKIVPFPHQLVSSECLFTETISINLSPPLFLLSFLSLFSSLNVSF